MKGASTRFFEALSQRGYEPLLRQGKGTLRFELANGKTERWRVAIDNGNVAVSHGGGAADCVLRADKKLFDSIVTGETNAMVAFLRGAVHFEGNPELMMLFQRAVRAGATS
jgi:putative sterol carrier protein